MSSQTPTAASSRLVCDASSSNSSPSMAELARCDTVSSTGSAARLPQGNWAFNLSGVCSTCHRYHKSLQVHVKVSDDSAQVGDVHCTNCRRLWLAFGKVNATRLSLLSVISIEPDQTETDFHSTLVRMIRAANAIAALSPTLTTIPEATPTGPSRETSVRSTRSGIQRPPTAIGNETAQTIDDTTTDFPGPTDISQNDDSTVQQRGRLGKRTIEKGRQVLLRARQKVGARFSTLQNTPLGLGEWFLRREGAEGGIRQRDVGRLTSGVPSAAVVSSVHDVSTETPAEIEATIDMAALNVCASSATATDALASLGALDPQVIQALPLEQRLTWGRRQLTDFRTHYPGSVQRVANHATVNSEAQTDRNEMLSPLHTPPARPPSILAYVGDGFFIPEYWIHDDRPLSMSETNLSEADTVFDGMSNSSGPRNIFLESLQHNRRGSGSPRPLSTNNVVQDWSQIHRNRAEARRSIDSTATGGAVRSITALRGRAVHRLSRTSLNRASSIYATEAPNSRAQLALEETEHASERHERRSPSPSVPSPPLPETDTAVCG